MAIDTVISLRGNPGGKLCADDMASCSGEVYSQRASSGAVEGRPCTARAHEVDDGFTAFPPLTGEQAAVLRAAHPSVSPWQIVRLQAVVGAGLALLAVLVTGRQEMGWSVLYGAAVVVGPAALMARGLTGPFGSLTPGAGVARFLFWQGVKVVAALAMLLAAPQLIQPLSWPAMLIGLVLCLKCYWVALLWRGSKKN